MIRKVGGRGGGVIVREREMWTERKMWRERMIGVEKMERESGEGVTK